MDVELSPDEARIAIMAGAARRLDSLMQARTEVYGAVSGGDYWSVDIEAAAAEMALAKAVGAYWSGWAPSPEHDRTHGDVAGLQVRHTRRTDGKLILHPRDADDHTFVLVIGAIPRFRVVGAILGRHGKTPEHWWGDAPRPAFFVPQSALGPLP